MVSVNGKNTTGGKEREKVEHDNPMLAVHLG